MVVRGSMILARRVPIAWITGPVTINQDIEGFDTSPRNHVVNDCRARVYGACVGFGARLPSLAFEHTNLIDRGKMAERRQP